MNSATKPVWFILGVVCLLIALVGIRQWFAGSPAQGDVKEKVAWQSDLSAAQSSSAQQNKPVLVYFTAKWCNPCQQMKATTWADDRVAAAMNNKYIPVKIDIDEHKDLAAQFGVRSIPRVDLLLPGGTHKTIMEGAAAPEEFLELLGEK